jgi:tetratricopeptide (TPR) repeat protein
LAREYLVRARATAPDAMSSDPVQSAWGRVWESLRLQLPEAGDEVQHPPHLSLLIEAAMMRRDYQRALQLGRKLAASPIYAAAAHFNVALALSHLGRFAEAEEELSTLKPGPPGTSYLRGVLAEKRGDNLTALDAYENSRKLDELHLPAMRRLAFCHIRTGAPRSAIPLFEAALSYTPLRPDLYGGLAVAHLHFGSAQRAAAQSARAIQAGVDPLLARKAVAKACTEAHAYGRAASELEACVAYDVTDLEAWADLATVCRWIGRFDREEECLRRVQAGDPGNRQLRLMSARCQRDQGRARETLEMLQPLLEETGPQQAEALVLAAEAAGSAGDKEGQRRFAQRAMECARSGATEDTAGLAQFWLADSFEVGAPEAEEAYRAAARAFKAQLAEGTIPRQAATLWQALYVAAVALGDETLKAQAERKARQEVSVCEALGVEVESVVHRRSVPSDVFLTCFTGSMAREVEQSGAAPEARPGASGVEAPVLRTRPGQRTQLRGS